jgi:hypothetical protein
MNSKKSTPETQNNLFSDPQNNLVNTANNITENTPDKDLQQSDSVKIKNSIFLAAIAQKIVNSDTIKEKMKKTGVLVLTVSNLIKSFPELEGLPPSLPLFKVSKNQYGNLQYLTLCVYKDGDNLVTVTPDMNASVVDGFSLKSFRLGRNSQSVIIYGDIELIAAIGGSNALREYLLDTDQDHIEGNSGDLNLDWIDHRPMIEIPLKSLTVKTPYTIVGTGKVSRSEYKTPLIDVKDVKGNILYNVLTNSFLTRYIENGGKKFQISEIITEKSNDKTKKDRTKVNIEPLDGNKTNNLKLDL